MLENTFVHVPGIGAQTEARLWQDGCLDWDRLIASWRDYSYGHADRTSVLKHIERSKRALESGEHQFFARSLKMVDTWRAFHEFRDSCVYLDIETDGGTAITMVGLYDGVDYKCLIKGEDLGNFVDVISQYSMIVSFAGRAFDLPQLQRNFRGLRFDQIHIDLCPVLRQAGIRGGLKRIEKEMGIERDAEIDGLTGMDAVRLWRRYTMLHEESSLDKLIAYNRADVVNLERLAEEAYSRLRALIFEPNLAAAS